MIRDSYNAIDLTSIPHTDSAAIRILVKTVTEQPDAHGWDFGIQQLTKRRARALNWDCYGYSLDVHSGNLVAVIQVREWTEGKRWNRVRKSYFLIGTNEDGSGFAHPVSHAPVHAAIAADRDPVLAAQNWIFGGDYSAMIRQGDIALIPMAKRPAGTKGARQRELVIEDSHVLTATQIARVGDRIYAKNPTVIHRPGTHPTVHATGWTRVIVGRRSRFWRFAHPTID